MKTPTSCGWRRRARRSQLLWLRPSAVPAPGAAASACGCYGTGDMCVYRPVEGARASGWDLTRRAVRQVRSAEASTTSASPSVPSASWTSSCWGAVRGGPGAAPGVGLRLSGSTAVCPAPRIAAATTTTADASSMLVQRWLFGGRPSSRGRIMVPGDAPRSGPGLRRASSTRSGSTMCRDCTPAAFGA